MFSFLKKFFGPGIDFKALYEAGAVIIDVRSPQEYDRGHIKGSKNIPLNLIQRDIDKLTALHKPIITVCQSGARSAMAKSSLKAAGLEVYNGGSWMSLNAKLNA
jgi:rhodanese-related sulfurtransferase